MSSDATNPPADAPRAVAFQGLGFAADLGARTFVPPQSWSQYAGLDESGLDDHHLMHLLEPVFGADGDPGQAPDVASLLDRWHSDGALVRDREPGMYVYRRTAGEHVLVGVVAAVPLAVDEEPTLLGHEQVIDRLVTAHSSLEAATSAQLEPIVALRVADGLAEDPVGQAGPTLTEVVEPVLTTEPDHRIGDDTAVHELWRVTDAATHRAVAAIAQAGSLLIADGHHRFRAWSAEASARSVAAVRPDPWAYAMTLLVDAADGGLRLGAVHRVITGIDLAAALREVTVDVETLDSTAAACDFLRSGHDARCVLATRDTAVGVTARTEAAGPTCAMPECAVCWLHDVWLPAWGADGAGVEYVHTAAAAVERAAAVDGIAVLLPPPGIDTVLQAARRGTPLPHKATSFGPKPRVGLVMRHWDHPGTDVAVGPDDTAEPRHPSDS